MSRHKRKPRKMPQWIREIATRDSGNGPILVPVDQYVEIVRWANAGKRPMGRLLIDRYPHSFHLLYGRELQIEE